MPNPNDMSKYNSNGGTEDISQSEHAGENQSISRELSMKLGNIAESRFSNEKILYGELKLLHADSERDYHYNRKQLEDYLNDVGMDSGLAEVLLDSGVFDLPIKGAYMNGGPERVILDKHLSELYPEFMEGDPYLVTKYRGHFNGWGHSWWSKHAYKVFDWGGMPLVYDSYGSTLDRVSLINPVTSKIIALGRRKNGSSSMSMRDPFSPSSSSEYSECSVVSRVNSQNLEDELGNFSFKIIDREEVESFLESQGITIPTDDPVENFAVQTKFIKQAVDRYLGTKNHDETG